MVIFVCFDSIGIQVLCLLVMIVIVLVFGWYLVVFIGGVDMLVVVLMFNFYLGWVVVVVGFMLSNDLLIVIGVLVGFFGVIFFYIMCKVMNCFFISVIVGGFGIDGFLSGGDEEVGEYCEISVEEMVEMLKNLYLVIIILGYGMVVVQVQYLVVEIIEKLWVWGIKVCFGIYLVVGCFLGYMNVLLVEVKVFYDIVLEMDEINDDFSDIDIVLVIGVNDIVNLVVQDDLKSLIVGMLVFEVWKVQNVVVFKCLMNIGYVGVQNLLFFKENIYMLFGDVKVSVDVILKVL